MWRCGFMLAMAGFLTGAAAEGTYGDDPTVLRMSEVVGIEVLTPEGRRLGTITDLLIERTSGSVEEVAVGAARYPIGALVSGARPGQVVLEPPGASSAGGTALLPPSAGKDLVRASRVASPEVLTVDLLQGRVRPVQ
jgi:sporulation protein YlmC with PRC-barrel domain